MVDNILGLNFCYFLNNAPNGPCTPTPADRNAIRAVQISLTAKAAVPDPHYTDQNSNNNSQYKQYTHYRKATLTSFVRFRNLGVNRGKDANGQPKILDFDETCPRQ